MKKICMISAVLALILSGCAKEMQPVQGTSSSGKVAGPQTICAGFSGQAARVALGDDGSAVSYNWKAGDRILFVNPSDISDSVYYKISSGAGTASASFTKSSGEFTSGGTYVCCHPGNGVHLNADGEFTDKNGRSLFNGQNPVHVENYMVFTGFSGSPKAYSFKGSDIPAAFSFEAPFTVLKLAVTNSSAEAVSPTGIRFDCGKGSAYFLGTLKLDADAGIAASDPVDYIQTGIWDGESIAAGGEGAYSFICVQNPSRNTPTFKVSLFY